jgi:GNAT superfamily N-acetyltransferase
MSKATIRLMTAAELERIAEIDRAEHITQQYTCPDGRLTLVDVDIRAQRWPETGEHSVAQRIAEWTSELESGGVLLGAFDGPAFVGIAIYDPPATNPAGTLPDDVAYLSVLYVTRTHRRTGLGRVLVDDVAQRAQSDGATRLYVSATPTRATVDFYLARGFEPLVTPNERLFAQEPDDVHMERVLIR